MKELPLTHKASTDQIPIASIGIVFVFLYFFVTGCTKHHQVFLNPSLPIHDSKIGNKIPVSLYLELKIIHLEAYIKYMEEFFQ